MISLRRSFRKPFALGFVLALLLICVVFDEGGHNRGNSLNKRKLENHEAVLFAQGILFTNSKRISSSENVIISPKTESPISIEQNGVLKNVKTRESGPHADHKKYLSIAKFQQEISVGYTKEIKNLTKIRNYFHNSASNDHMEIHPLWMRITDDIYIYSGFWDQRQEIENGPLVRILGIVRFKKELLPSDYKFSWKGDIKENTLNCSCLLWYKGHNEPHLGSLKAHVYEEGREMFAGTFFLCYPKYDNNTGEFTIKKDMAPYAVSLQPSNAINAPYKLIYLNPSPSINKNLSENKNTTAICVRALFGPYSDLHGMVQFLAYYTAVMKIFHFTFYDLAVDPRVRNLLELLSSSGLFSYEVLPWNLPTSEWGELWDIGSLTALNDCMYRNSGKHSHIAIVDIDEFIVPRTPVNGVGDLYDKVIKFRRGQQGDGVLISNVFYCFDFKDSDLNIKTNNSFHIFQYTQREAHLWSPKNRSKMIVIPQFTVAIGHHMVHKFIAKNLENRSSPKLLSVLHHYRQCADIRLGIHANGKKILKEPTVKDAAMLKYKKVVLNSEVMTLYRKYFVQS